MVSMLVSSRTISEKSNWKRKAIRLDNAIPTIFCFYYVNKDVIREKILFSTQNRSY